MTYDIIIGLGGIGAGVLFALRGNETFGRNESRLGDLLQSKDYCKGHIILHYAARLSGRPTYLLGKLGQDAAAETLLGEMQDAGIDTRCIERDPQRPTMFSVCTLYPDNSGGNITSGNSACEAVDAAYINRCLAGLPPGKNTIVLAAPEVPLEARGQLLQCGRKAGAFTAASFAAEELRGLKLAAWLGLVDLLALNEEEAQALAASTEKGAALAAACHARMKNENPGIRLLMTAGPQGAFLCEKESCVLLPAADVPVVSTAGAGDAFLGGTLAAMALGLPFLQAAHVGSAAAGFAVSCGDSIAMGITRQQVLQQLDDADVRRAYAQNGE